MANNIFI